MVAKMTGQATASSCIYAFRMQKVCVRVIGKPNGTEQDSCQDGIQFKTFKNIIESKLIKALSNLNRWNTSKQLETTWTNPTEFSKIPEATSLSAWGFPRRCEVWPAVPWQDVDASERSPYWRYTEHYWTICLLITFHVFVRIFGDTKRCQTETSISLFWKFQFVSLLMTGRGPEAQAKSPRHCVATVVVCRSRPYFWSLDGSRIGFQESCEEDNIGKDFLLIAQWMKKDYKKSKVQHFSFACPTLCVFCVSWNQNIGRYAFTFAPASHRCYWMLEMFEMQDQFSIYRTTNC